jgi:Phosphotransferase enzyme family
MGKIRGMPGRSEDDEGTLAPPASGVWEQMGLTVVGELNGGHQSRAVLVHRDAEQLVIKLTDARLVDLQEFETRIGVVRDLAAVDEHAVGPIEIGPSLINHLGGWLAVAYPYVPGPNPDPENRAEVKKLARSLAALHHSLRRLTTTRPLPLVAALRASGPLADALPDPVQLLRGDYSPANVLLDGDRTRVIDFDDCGYGPIEFELGNERDIRGTIAIRLAHLDRVRPGHKPAKELCPADLENAEDRSTIQRLLNLSRPPRSCPSDAVITAKIIE